MHDVLARICADKREHIAACKAARTLADVESDARRASPPLGFINKLESTLAGGPFALIAEIKKASPSKGLIRSDFDPPALARSYRDGGAACLSVLTDVPYFQGHDSFLTAARDAARLPCLRKDFTLDPYQIYEARALGADAVLLIMAALDDVEAGELAACAEGVGLDVLVEVHDAAELDRALRLKSRLIGINNRNLKTLTVDLATTLSLAPRVPSDRLVVAESGLHYHDDLVRMSKVGARCFLVGESLMRQPDVTTATRKLLGNGVAA